MIRHLLIFPQLIFITKITTTGISIKQHKDNNRCGTAVGKIDGKSSCIITEVIIQQ